MLGQERVHRCGRGIRLRVVLRQARSELEHALIGHRAPLEVVAERLVLAIAALLALRPGLLRSVSGPSH